MQATTAMQPNNATPTAVFRIMQLNKFGFLIRAQNGAVIEKVMIHAKSEEDIRAKLKFRKPARMPIRMATGF